MRVLATRIFNRRYQTLRTMFTTRIPPDSNGNTSTNASRRSLRHTASDVGMGTRAGNCGRLSGADYRCRAGRVSQRPIFLICQTTTPRCPSHFRRMANLASSAKFGATLAPIAEIPKVMINAVLRRTHASISAVAWTTSASSALVWQRRACEKPKAHPPSPCKLRVTSACRPRKPFTPQDLRNSAHLQAGTFFTKDQILEIYMNQIFPGQPRLWICRGVEAYFGKTVEGNHGCRAAMLAGLPKAPSAYNPSATLRAAACQRYIIDRMLENGFISEKEAGCRRTSL